MTDLNDASNILAERLVHDTVGRPTMGGWVDIHILQDRALLYALSPGTKELLYYAGRLVGAAYARQLGKKTGLSEALDLYSSGMAERKIARVEVASLGAEAVTLRLHENATAYGLPNLGLKVCGFDAGGQAGMLTELTGKRVVSTEVKCCASGDSYCEFDLRVIPTAEKAFAEAFKI